MEMHQEKYVALKSEEGVFFSWRGFYLGDKIVITNCPFFYLLYCLIYWPSINFAPENNLI